MTILTEVNRNANGALYHARDLDTGLDVCIKGFDKFIELFPSQAGFLSEFRDVIKVSKETNLSTIGYLDTIAELTNREGKE